MKIAHHRHPIGGYTDEDRATWIHFATVDEMRLLFGGSDCAIVAGGPSSKGAGPSSTDELHANYMAHWTIGCNRAVEFCRPDLAACFEPRKDLDVWAVIKACPIPWVLSHISRDHQRLVLTPSKEDMKIAANAPLEFGQSPFYSMVSAVLMGFDTIGVIGLDMTRDRYNFKLGLEEAAYEGVCEFAESQGSRIINLNPDSRLQAIPKGGWEEIRGK